MATTRCPQCSAGVPHEARFCPRCGRAVDDGAPFASAGTGGTNQQPTVAPRAAGALPSSSRMPLAGILFLVAAILGPTMIAVGVSAGSPLLLVAGIGVAILLIALLLIGMVF